MGLGFKELKGFREGQRREFLWKGSKKKGGRGRAGGAAGAHGGHKRIKRVKKWSTAVVIPALGSP